MFVSCWPVSRDKHLVAAAPRLVNSLLGENKTHVLSPDRRIKDFVMYEITETATRKDVLHFASKHGHT